MYDGSKGRYEVRLSGPGAKVLSLKPVNFILPENTRVMVRSYAHLFSYFSLALSLFLSSHEVLHAL
jgi:VanZ family protein